MESGIFDRAMRGAIVGYGFIASQGHAPGYAECNRRNRKVQIVAVADGCEARRQQAKAAFPSAALHDNYRALLDKHVRDLDFIDIAVPPAYHAEIAHAALECGLHVLCEKPLTMSVAEAIELTKKAVQHRRVLFPCHNYRHAPSVRAVRQILNDEIIGSVTSVTQQTFRPTHARGVSEWRPDWRRDPACAGGGILMDHGSHTLYLAFEWLGGYPLAVSARTYAFDGLETEDNVSSTFQYSKGIAQAVLSWTAGARKVLYTLHGTRGAIIVDDDAIRVMLRDSAARLPAHLASTNGTLITDSRWNDASHREWFADMFEQFMAAIEEGACVGKDTRDAVECMNAIDACYRSAHADGREVRIERPAALSAVEMPLASTG